MKGDIGMPELKCTVQTCAHNQKSYCMLDKIQVGGNQAKRAQDTCCDSFQERTSDSMKDTYSNSMSNVSGTAADCSCIDCKANDCMYNESCKCQAGKVSVEGGSACQKEGTQCATFKCRG